MPNLWDRLNTEYGSVLAPAAKEQVAKDIELSGKTGRLEQATPYRGSLWTRLESDYPEPFAAQKVSFLPKPVDPVEQSAAPMMQGDQTKRLSSFYDFVRQEAKAAGTAKGIGLRAKHKKYVQDVAAKAFPEIDLDSIPFDSMVDIASRGGGLADPVAVGFVDAPDDETKDMYNMASALLKSQRVNKGRGVAVPKVLDDGEMEGELKPLMTRLKDRYDKYTPEQRKRFLEVASNVAASVVSPSKDHPIARSVATGMEAPEDNLESTFQDWFGDKDTAQYTEFVRQFRNIARAGSAAEPTAHGLAGVMQRGVYDTAEMMPSVVASMGLTGGASSALGAAGKTALGAKVSGALAGIGKAGQVAATAGKGVAGAAPAASFWGAQEYPDLKASLVEAGVSDEQAKPLAAAGAAVIGAIEMFEKEFGIRGPKVTSAAGGLRSRVAEFLVKSGVNFGKEWSEEAMQAGAASATRLVASALTDSGFDWNKEWESGVDQVVQAAIPLMLMQAPGTAAAGVREVKRGVQESMAPKQTEVAPVSELAPDVKAAPLAEVKNDTVSVKSQEAPGPAEDRPVDTTKTTPAVETPPDEKPQPAKRDIAKEIGDLLPDIKRMFPGVQDADADDLASDTVMKALEKKDQFDPEKGELKDWVSGIAKNVLRDKFGETTTGEVPESAEPAAPLEEPGPQSMDDLRAKDVDELQGLWQAAHPKSKQRPPNAKGALVRQIWKAMPAEAKVEKTLGEKVAPVAEPKTATELPVEVEGQKLKVGDWMTYKDGTPFKVAHAYYDPRLDVTTIVPSYETFSKHGRVPNEMTVGEVTRRAEESPVSEAPSPVPTAEWSAIPEGESIRDVLANAGIKAKDVEYSGDYKQWRLKEKPEETAPSPKLPPKSEPPKTIATKKPTAPPQVEKNDTVSQNPPGAVKIDTVSQKAEGDPRTLVSDLYSNRKPITEVTQDEIAAAVDAMKSMKVPELREFAVGLGMSTYGKKSKKKILADLKDDLANRRNDATRPGQGPPLVEPGEKTVLRKKEESPGPETGYAKTITAPMSVGDNQSLMGVESTLARAKSVAGVRFELFNGASLKEPRATIRQYDEDSGSVVEIRQFPTYDTAEKAFTERVKQAIAMEQPPAKTIGKKEEAAPVTKPRQEETSGGGKAAGPVANNAAVWDKTYRKYKAIADQLASDIYAAKKQGKKWKGKIAIPESPDGREYTTRIAEAEAWLDMIVQDKLPEFAKESEQAKESKSIVRKSAMPVAEEEPEAPPAEQPKRALSPGEVRGLNQIAGQRSTAPWWDSNPTTKPGKRLLKKLTNDKKNRVGLKSIIQTVGDVLGSITIVGKSQLSRRTPAHYEPRPHLIRTKAEQSLFTFHELGHAMSRVLSDYDPVWMDGHEQGFINFTTMQGSVASAETAEEGMAEFVRRYITNYRSLPEAFRTAVEDKIKSLSPDLLGAMQDAHRAFSYHRSRPMKDQDEANRNDRGIRKAKLTDAFGILKSGAYNVFGAEVVPYAIRMRFERALAAHSKEVYQQFLEGTEGQKADLYNAYASTLLAPLESLRAMLGDKRGAQGVRVLAWGDEMLADEDIEALTDAGFEVPEMAKHGEWIQVSTKSFEDIRREAGDNWGWFESYGFRRAALERLKKAGHMEPGLAAGYTVEESQDFILETEKSHPEWDGLFKDVQKYFDSLLLVATLNGEFSIAEAVTIKQAWEDYWPLQRQVEGTDSVGGGGTAEMDIAAGVFRAFGSPLQFRSLIEAAEYRTKKTLDSYYQNRLRKAFLEYDKELEKLEGIPGVLKTEGARLMLPLNMDRKVVARISPEQQLGWFADEVVAAINNDRAQQLGRELEEDEMATVDDIDISLPWRTIYKAKKPGAIQVVGTYEGGNVKFYQVLDPLLYDMLAKSNDVSALMGKVRGFIRNTLVKTLEPWKRNVTGNVVFALRNIPRDMVTAYIMGDGLKSLIPGRYIARGILGRVTGQTKADPPPRLNLYSRTLDDLSRPAHKKAWDRFREHFLDETTQGLHIRGWKDMNAVDRIKELPGIISSAAALPITMANWATGGRALSQFTEDAAREGAWLVARDRGATAETSSRAGAEITGNFGQRQPNAIFRDIVRGAGFMNPGLQIVWGTYKHMITPDMGQTRYNLFVKAPLIGAIGAAASALNIALVYAMFGWRDDDDDLKEVLDRMRDQPEYERRTHMTVMGMLRSPFEAGPHGALFSTGWNVAQDYILDGGTDAPLRAKELLKNFAFKFPGASDFIQPQVKAAMEVNMGPGGFSFYRNAEIVPNHLQTYFPNEPEKQVFRDTPEAYKWLHQNIGGHPLKWEYFLRSVFTRQLTDSVYFADKLSKTGKFEPKNLPIVRGILTQDAIGYRSQSVQALRDLAEEFNGLADSLKTVKDPKARAALETQIKAVHEARMAFEGIDTLWEEAKKEDKKPNANREKIRGIEKEMTNYARGYINYRAGRRATPPARYAEAVQSWLGTKINKVTAPKYVEEGGDGRELSVFGYTYEQAQKAFRAYWIEKHKTIREEDGTLKKTYRARLSALRKILVDKPSGDR